MQLKDKKLFLEVYGLLRMALGIVQLEGIFFGFFLNEFIIKYPSQAIPTLFSPDVVALIYFAIVLRSVFHLIVGIGISRLQNWARFWILSGWPIIILINIGLAYSLYQEWLLDGYSLKNFYSVINFFKVFMYMIFICSDMFFINVTIRTMNTEANFIEESGGRIEKQKVGILFFIIIFVLSVLLFLGKPIRQGFHRGFYKVRVQKNLKGKQVSALEYKGNVKGDRKEGFYPEKIKKPVEQIVQQKKETSILVNDKIQTGGIKREIKGVKKESIRAGLSYKEIIGFAAGLCFIIAFLFQLLQVDKIRPIRDILTQSYLFFIVGFFLLVFYGAISQLASLWVTGGICFFMVLGLLIFMLKKVNDFD